MWQWLSLCGYTRSEQEDSPVSGIGLYRKPGELPGGSSHRREQEKQQPKKSDLDYIEREHQTLPRKPKVRGTMKKYYIPFNILADVNYLYLFALYDLAEFNPDTGNYDTIHYKSINELAGRLQISSSTLNRILCNEHYSDFIELNKQNKTLFIRNDFKNGKKRPFVVLSDTEVIELKKLGDSLLIRYFLYIKYYCGFSPER